MKIAMVQTNPQDDKDKNIKDAEKLISDVTGDNPDLVVLPECWTYMDTDVSQIHAHAETFPEGIAYQTLKNLAQKYNITLHGGSMLEKDGDTYYNSTVVFNPKGEEIAKYRKIHLFNVDVPGGASYRESDTCSAGDDIVLYDCNGVTVGCAICYDIRFPELFAKLREQGADVIVLPAAFTLMTGKDHWEILSRARAIETQTYFVSVGQFGTYANGRRSCYGHSMIVDPWGHITAQIGDHVGVTSANIDLQYGKSIRQRLPVAEHHRI